MFNEGLKRSVFSSLNKIYKKSKISLLTYLHKRLLADIHIHTNTLEHHLTTHRLKGEINKHVHTYICTLKHKNSTKCRFKGTLSASLSFSLIFFLTGSGKWEVT